MHSMNTRKFSRQFKLAVCRAVKAGHVTRGAVAAHYSIGPSVVWRWYEIYREKGEEAFASSVSHEMEAGTLAFLDSVLQDTEPYATPGHLPEVRRFADRKTMAGKYEPWMA